MSERPPLFTTDFDPILISSPAPRSGTTLLQRLLCSSPRALVYGETCGQDLDLFVNLYASREMLYTHNRQQLANSLRGVLAGAVNSWTVDLMPEVDEYLRALGRSCLGWLACCRDSAARAGRSVWGIKLAGWRPYSLGLMRRLMPRSRLLYVRRDVADCLKSAKARQMVRSPEQVSEFCRLWGENLSYVLGLGADPALLVINYTDLASEPARALERIAAFTGVADMDPRVLDHKINTRAGAGPEGENYVQPASLTEEESQIAAAVTAALRGRFPDG
jgi:hypothetical protein